MEVTDLGELGDPLGLSTAWLTRFWSMEGILPLRCGGRVTHQRAIEAGHGLGCLALSINAGTKEERRQAGR